jgi:NADH-ubiquinone oxidoreductase chain 4
MLLAAVLLKLGGYGLVKLRFIVGPINSISLILIRLILLGGGLIGILCLRQLDIKVIIAYSSVRHIAFVAAGFLLNSS